MIDSLSIVFLAFTDSMLKSVSFNEICNRDMSSGPLTLEVYLYEYRCLLFILKHLFYVMRLYIETDYS